jgi:hypothetical protein
MSIRRGDTVAYRWTDGKVYYGKVTLVVKDCFHVYSRERHKPQDRDLVHMNMIISEFE